MGTFSRGSTKLDEFKQDGVTPRCKAEVLERGISFPRYNQCERAGTVERDGQMFCYQHDPMAVAERERERNKKGQAEWNKRRLELYGSAFFDVLRRIAEGHNDPRALAQRTIEEFYR